MNIGLDLPTSELAILFRFLGRLWLRELDTATRDDLLGELADSWKSMGGALPNELVDDLQADFCQLFSHPKSYVAPFQSVWTIGQLDGPPAQAMRWYIEESGYADADGLDEVPDHLGVQLDLAGWLLSQEPDTANGTELVVAVAERFMTEHLQWTDSMLGRAEVAAETDFYRGLVCVTRNMLEYRL